MNYSKSLIILLVLSAFLGIFAFAGSLNVASALNETQITPTGPPPLNVVMGNFQAVITVTIKNKANHVEFFKISQKYTDSLTTPIQWNVVWTDPAAVKMISNANPTIFGNNSTITNSTGDLGWEIEPGQTKTVKFKLQAVGLFSKGNESGIIDNNNVPNTFWPLLSEPGLTSSLFLPNEIETLNPSLKVVDWTGTFDFDLKNDNPDLAGPRAEGIVEAPIVPLNSELTFSDPKADFIDTTLIGENAAAWDVTVFPGADPQHFTYTYHYPKPGSTSTSASAAGATSIPTQATNTTPQTSSIPTTGTPYGLLVLAVVVVGAGLAYAKFLR